MIKKSFFIFSLFAAVLFFMSCSNLLGDNNKKGTAISLSLPYGKAGLSSSSRAAENDKISYKFTVTFKHETEPEKIIEGKSGESITYEDAPPGKYTITVKGKGEKGETVEGSAEATVSEGQETKVSIKLYRTDVIEINALSHTDELSKMLEMYITMHPDCGFVVNYKEIDAKTGDYTPYLDAALTGNSKDGFIPDIWGVEAAFVMHYTQGAMGDYALPYNELIQNLDQKISDGKIAQYTVDIGKNKSNEVVGLAYQSTGGAFIYNRSVAKEVFGFDDPELVAREMGAGSESLDKFWEVAEKCKAKGISIVSGDGDLWHVVDGSAETPWVVNGKLHIDTKRAKFLDYAKLLTDEGYSNDVQDWSPEWYEDMAENGPRRILGTFGPAWLINYVMAGCAGNTYGDWAVCTSPVSFSWGGTWIQVNKKIASANPAKKGAIEKFLEWATLDTTEEGFLYQWANGCFSDVKDTVSSAVVMEKANGELAYLGGQDMFKCYIPANNNIKKIVKTEYDDVIDNIWREQVRLYADGILSRDQAMLNFIYGVQVRLGIDSEDELPYEYYESEHVRAEPDPDGKGIRFTISAKEGEFWPENSARIFDRDGDYFIKIKDKNPTPDEPIVVYWPFTENGKGYSFDCEFKVNDKDEPIHEYVYCFAKGSGATVNVDYDKLAGFAPELDIDTGKVKLNKDIRGAVSYSSNVCAKYDFGGFTNDVNTPGEFHWSEWLNSIFPDFLDAKLLSDGYDFLEYSRHNIDKFRMNKYCFINLELEFFVENIPERFTYQQSFLSDIYDVSEKISNLTQNRHIAVEPCSEGIKVTLRHLDGEPDWVGTSAVRCLTEDGRESFTVDIGQNSEYLQLSSDKPTGSFIYPFTENGQSYAFEFSGCMFNEQGPWFSEYVCCKAGGGTGEPLDVNYWNNQISIEYENSLAYSFRFHGDILKVFKANSVSEFEASDLFDKLESAVLCIDVYGGDPEHREADEKFRRSPHYALKYLAKYEGDTEEHDYHDRDRLSELDGSITCSFEDDEVHESGRFFFYIGVTDIKFKDDPIYYHLPWNEFRQ